MRVARRVAETAAVLPAPVPPASDKFAVLRRAGRVWAVAAIHGEAERLAALHDALAPRFDEDDRLVYLGNYLGIGPAAVATLDELLRFRRAIIARPRLFASDIVYLRGSQEEMWQKLLQLQFAVNPRQVLDWMLNQGMAATLSSYGGDAQAGRRAMAEGAVAIGRWTAGVRQAMADRPGHRALMSTLRRAAYTDDGGLLFVHAGLDPAQPLAAQTDALWWGHPGWRRLVDAYEGFHRVVRGRDPAAQGPTQVGMEGPHRLTIDGGCGFGGNLVALCLSPDGEMLDRIEA